MDPSRSWSDYRDGLVSSFVPGLKNFPAKYSQLDLVSDLSSGATVFVFIVPQGMAYAILADLPPVYGLYTATVPLILYALFGTSRELAVGPMAITSLLLGVSCQKYNFEEESKEYIEIAMKITFMVGINSLVFGLCRLGSAINLVSPSVLSGFLTASAMVIALNQFQYVLGFEVPRFEYSHQTIDYIIQHIGDTNDTSILIGSFTMVILYVMKRWKEAHHEAIVEPVNAENFSVKILAIWANMSNLLAIVGGAVIARSLIESGEKIEIVGFVPSGLKEPTLQTILNIFTAVTSTSIFPGDDGFNSTTVPDAMFGAARSLLKSHNATTIPPTNVYSAAADAAFDAGTRVNVWHLVPDSFAIAVVAFAGNWATAKKCADARGYKVNASQELIAAGIMNTVGVIFHSYVASGGIARTAVSIESGAITQISGCVVAILVTISLMFFTDFFYYIPMPSLGAVLEISVLSMVDFSAMAAAYRLDKRDFAIMVTTFFCTFFLGLVYGLLIGIMFSISVVIYHSAFPKFEYMFRKSILQDPALRSEYQQLHFRDEYGRDDGDLDSDTEAGVVERGDAIEDSFKILDGEGLEMRAMADSGQGVGKSLAPAASDSRTGVDGSLADERTHGSAAAFGLPISISESGSTPGYVHPMSPSAKEGILQQDNDSNGGALINTAEHIQHKKLTPRIAAIRTSSSRTWRSLSADDAELYEEEDITVVSESKHIRMHPLASSPAAEGESALSSIPSSHTSAIASSEICKASTTLSVPPRRISSDTIAQISPEASFPVAMMKRSSSLSGDTTSRGLSPSPRFSTVLDSIAESKRSESDSTSTSTSYTHSHSHSNHSSSTRTDDGGRHSTTSIAASAIARMHSPSSTVALHRSNETARRQNPLQAGTVSGSVPGKDAAAEHRRGFRVREMTDDETKSDRGGEEEVTGSSDSVVVCMHGPLYFANCEAFETAVINATDRLIATSEDAVSAEVPSAVTQPPASSAFTRPSRELNFVPTAAPELPNVLPGKFRVIVDVSTWTDMDLSGINAIFGILRLLREERAFVTKAMPWDLDVSPSSYFSSPATSRGGDRFSELRGSFSGDSIHDQAGAIGAGGTSSHTRRAPFASPTSLPASAASAAAAGKVNKLSGGSAGGKKSADATPKVSYLSRRRTVSSLTLNEDDMESSRMREDLAAAAIAQVQARANVTLALACVSDLLLRRLSDTGLLDAIGAENVHVSIRDAMNRVPFQSARVLPGDVSVENRSAANTNPALRQEENRQSWSLLGVFAPFWGTSRPSHSGYEMVHLTNDRVDDQDLDHDPEEGGGAIELLQEKSMGSTDNALGSPTLEYRLSYEEKTEFDGVSPVFNPITRFRSVNSLDLGLPQDASTFVSHMRSVLRNSKEGELATSNDLDRHRSREESDGLGKRIHGFERFVREQGLTARRRSAPSGSGHFTIVSADDDEDPDE